MKYFSKWDEIDKFLYFDHWHVVGHGSSIPYRNKNINYLFSILRKQGIHISCCESTCYELINKEMLEDDKYMDSFKIKKEEKFKTINLLKTSEFEIIEYQRGQIILKRDNRLIKIKFVSNLKFSFLIKHVENNLGSFSYNLTEIKYQQFLRLIKRFYKKIYLFYKRRYLKLNKKLIRYKFNQRADVSEKSNDIILNYKAFLNLNIEPKHSINWILRKRHLNLVTNNKKNIKIKQIISYLTKSKIENLLNDVVESNNQFIFDEPISHNKSFWTSGNNYFLYNIIYSFRKNVVSYQEANMYIAKDNVLNLYSSDYYRSLEKMNAEDVRSLLDQNPIEISNNSVTSGKHRVFAMIGWLLEGNDYIPFKATIY